MRVGRFVEVQVALLIPALNEAGAMPRTAAAARAALDKGLVTRAVVLDGGSHDATSRIALDGGFEVIDVRTVLFDGRTETVNGKGDSLARGVRAIEADWYVFLDADLGNVSVDHVGALVAPIAESQMTGVRFVKGGFRRVDEHGVPRAVAGGRVTEEVGRQLVARVAPELAALTQPLSGQVAIEGGLARSLTIENGYGIEIAMLIDVWRTVGPSGMVEVDMGDINNRWKSDDALDTVTRDVLAAAASRGVHP